MNNYYLIVAYPSIIRFIRYVQQLNIADVSALSINI
jgi:hypothetical protein